MGEVASPDVEKVQRELKEYREQQQREGKPVAEFVILDEKTIHTALAGFRLAVQGMGKTLQMATKALVKAIKKLEAEQRQQQTPARRWVYSSALSQPLSARIALPYETLRHSYGRRNRRRSLE